MVCHVWPGIQRTGFSPERRTKLAKAGWGLGILVLQTDGLLCRAGHYFQLRSGRYNQEINAEGSICAITQAITQELVVGTAVQGTTQLVLVWREKLERMEPGRMEIMIGWSLEAREAGCRC